MGNKGSVLVVDDQSLNVKLLDSILSRLGFDVLKAYAGEEALSIAHDNIPDIILLDIMMPGMDGLQTCQMLKADPATSGIPVIFISALTDISDKVNAFTYGGVDYITKPFQKEEIVARVESHLRIYRLQKSLDEKNTHLQQTQNELTILNQLLAEYNDKLEDMVRARTQELDNTNKQLTA
ncbi:MAG: response regulator, partial [Nitrospirae bacterium]|nr:response regulator [Nitrospirota bacterium]